MDIVSVSKRIRAYNEGWADGMAMRSVLRDDELEREVRRAHAVWYAEPDELQRRRAFGYLDGLRGYEGSD